jgi:outer membrane biosynthesis protein TonB
MTRKARLLTPEQQLGRLLRIRWAARGVLALGVAASVMANVLHAEDNPISQSIAAWPPLALLITVEFILPIPVHRRWLANIRLVGTALIAGIAAWVSYWHMVGVVLRYGESADVAYLLPLSVDGLVVVASVSLVELSGNIRALTTALSSPAAPPASNPPAPPRTPPTPTASATGMVPPLPGPEPGSTAKPSPQAGREAGPPSQPAVTPAPRREPEPDKPKPETDGRASSVLSQQPPRKTRSADGAKPAGPDDQPPTDTAAAVAYWHHRDPTLGIPEIAAKIGKSSRTVRRYWPDPTGNKPSADAAANRRA